MELTEETFVNDIVLPIEVAKKDVNTIIISDIHLGSEVARPKQLRKMLHGYSYERLILLGDIFDDLNFKRLKKEHWNLLSYIRKLSKPGKNPEVIWVEGNHDEGLSEIMSVLIGIEVYKEYSWEFEGKRFLAIHGHQFDRFLNENVIISNITSYIYTKLQKWGKENQSFPRYIKKKSKGWLRLSHKVADSAINYAQQHKADVVFCGHTHLQLSKNENGVEYFNSGCWTDIPSHYIVINHNGSIEMKEFR